MFERFYYLLKLKWQRSISNKVGVRYYKGCSQILTSSHGLWRSQKLFLIKMFESSFGLFECSHTNSWNYISHFCEVVINNTKFITTSVAFIHSFWKYFQLDALDCYFKSEKHEGGVMPTLPFWENLLQDTVILRRLPKYTVRLCLCQNTPHC
jgi:hypothetical protein